MADINNDNSFMIRFKSSIVLMAVTVASIVLGGYVLFGVLLVVSLIGLSELYKAVEIDKKLLGFSGYLFTSLWYIFLLLSENRIIPQIKRVYFIMGFIALALTIMLVIFVFAFPKYSLEQLTTAFFGLFYVVFSLSLIYLIRMMDGGRLAVWLVFLGSWGADTGAYMVGRKIGRHKITPKLSPKKSLEGFIGGIIWASLLGFIYSFCFRERLSVDFNNPVVVFTITVAVASGISMIGDLAASAIKRLKGIKDYGKLIPGHGGILDRFDSVIFVTPIIYFLLLIMG